MSPNGPRATDIAPQPNVRFHQGIAAFGVLKHLWISCVPSGRAGGFVFATLHLWLRALTQTITGLQWLALAFKKSRQTGPGFAERFSSNMKLNSRRTSAQDVVLGSCKE